MPRYIDADILVETIKIHAENVKCENEFANEVYKLAHEHIVEVVGAQPTAYDVDAVVAELEKCEEYETESHNYNASTAFNNAIDIVRNAGKEVKP